MKSCMPSGTRPVKSAANHAMIDDDVGRDRRRAQSTITCGISRMILKNTVKRERSRS